MTRRMDERENLSAGALSESAADALGALVREGNPPPSLLEAHEQRRRFALAFAARRDRRRPFGAWATAFGVGACCAALAMFVWSTWRRDEALTVTQGKVEPVTMPSVSRPAVSAPSVGETLPEGTTLTFSEGTVAAVGAKSRAVISQLGQHGATLTLVQGVLNLRVTKRPRAAWRVEAGPYLVEVTGTVFDVHWQQETGDFRVDLRSGSVRVSGPGLAARTPLRAGHRLVVEAGSPSIEALNAETVQAARVTPAASGDRPPLASSQGARRLRLASGPQPRQVARAPREAPPAIAEIPTWTGSWEAAKPLDRPREARPEGARVAPETSPPPAETAVVPPSFAPRSRPTTTWEERLVAGEHDLVVSEAERLGLDDVLASRPLSDLKALADASRYSRRPHLARRALEALRARFARSPAAQIAAFELGRLMDDGVGTPEQAARWYHDYLKEAPKGALAEEALARLMVARTRQGEEGQAKEAARRYLREHPHGSRAPLAEQILGRGAKKP